MGLPNGVHHLAICTRDMKAQIEFFTQVLGMEMLEVSTSEGRAIDQEAWIDPEVVRLNGINPQELERYKRPPAFESRRGTAQNPAADPDNPPMRFPPGREVIYRMSDEDVTAKLSETTPPVQPTADSHR